MEDKLMPLDPMHIKNFNKAKVKGGNFHSGSGPGANSKSKPAHAGPGLSGGPQKPPRANRK